MPSIYAFADELARICPHLGAVQHHKHLYRFWRKRLLETGEAPFAEMAVSERLGPYFQSLDSYRLGRSNEVVSSTDSAVLTAIVAEFDGLSGKELAKRSHDEYLEWGFSRLGLKPTQAGNVVIMPELVRTLAPLDRLGIEGKKVKVFRPDDSHEELQRGIEQLSVLYRMGAHFDEVLIQER